MRIRTPFRMRNRTLYFQYRDSDRHPICNKRVDGPLRSVGRSICTCLGFEPKPAESTSRARSYSVGRMALTFQTPGNSGVFCIVPSHANKAKKLHFVTAA
jgi:hypothetical protein